MSKSIYFNIGISLAFLSSIIGSLATIIYKPLMQVGISPLYIGLVESITIIIFLSIFTNVLQSKIAASPNKVPMLIGACFHGLGTYSSFLALNCLDPIVFSFLGRNQVTISLLLGYFLLNERHTLIIWCFLIMLLIGSILLSYADLDNGNYFGIFLTFIACLSFSLRGYILRCYPNQPILSNILYGYSLTFLLILISIYLQKNNVLSDLLSLRIIFSISLTSIISVLGSIYLYMKALNYEKLSLVSSIRLFSPYIVTIYFIYFEDYQLKMINLYGLIIMTIALLIYFLKKYYFTDLPMARDVTN